MSKNAHLSIRLTQDERQALERTAQAGDLSVAQLVRRGIREVTRGSAEKTPPPGKPRLRKAAQPVGREIEARWLSEHQAELGAFRGEWIVVDGEGIVAHGRDLKSVYQEVRRWAIEAPYVVFVPPKPTDAVMMGL